VLLAVCHLYNRHINVFVLDDWNNENVIFSRTQCPGRREREKKRGSKILIPRVPDWIFKEAISW